MGAWKSIPMRTSEVNHAAIEAFSGRSPLQNDFKDQMWISIYESEEEVLSNENVKLFIANCSISNNFGRFCHLTLKMLKLLDTGEVDILLAEKITSFLGKLCLRVLNNLDDVSTFGAYFDFVDASRGINISAASFMKELANFTIAICEEFVLNPAYEVVLSNVMDLFLVLFSSQMVSGHIPGGDNSFGGQDDASPTLFLDLVVQGAYSEVFVSEIANLFVASTIPAEAFVTQMYSMLSNLNPKRSVMALPYSIFYAFRAYWYSEEALKMISDGSVSLLILADLHSWNMVGEGEHGEHRGILARLEDSGLANAKESVSTDEEAGFGDDSGVSSPQEKNVISFQDLFLAFQRKIEDESVIVFFYILISRNRAFREYILQRDDVYLIVVPILKYLYERIGPQMSPSSLYLHLIILLIVSGSEGALKTLNGKTTAAPWYNETRLGDINVTSLIMVILLRNLHRSFYIYNDEYFLVNTLGIISNVAGRIEDIHIHASELLISFERLLSHFRPPNVTHLKISFLHLEPILSTLFDTVAAALKEKNSSLAYSALRLLGPDTFTNLKSVFSSDVLERVAIHAAPLERAINDLRKLLPGDNVSPSEVQEVISKEIGNMKIASNLQLVNYEELRSSVEYFVPFAWWNVMQTTNKRIDWDMFRYAIFE